MFPKNNFSKYKISGIKNQGNTCYLNSVLQNLNNLHYFKKNLKLKKKIFDIFSEKKILKNSKILKKKNFYFSDIVNSILKDLEKNSEYEERINLKILEIRKNLLNGIFEKNEQNDSFEFLKILLYKIHDENNSQKKNMLKITKNFLEEKNNFFESFLNFKKFHQKIEKSFISKNFEGTFLSKIKCLNCQKKILFFEKFGDFSLNFFKKIFHNKNFSENNFFSIEELITNFFKNEKIKDFFCKNCGKKNEIEKTQKIIKYPKILIILIKRFQYFPNPKKISKKINFEKKLNLKNFYFNFKNEKNKKGKKIFLKEKEKGIYNLNGIINHFGNLNFGHYKSICKIKNFNTWIEFNDMFLNEMDFDKVKEENGENVYILFYEREN